MNKHVNEQWAARIKQSAELYSSLKYLCADEYWPGVCGASLGRGNKSLYEWLRSHDQDGCHDYE